TDEKTKNGKTTTKGGQTVVKNFTNNGTIESKDQNAAVRLQGAKIETFKNEKLISATGNAVAIKIERNGQNNPNGYDGSIETFINEGTIKANGQGIGLTNATITNFTNSGTISAAGQGAVSLAHATITSFENKGLIENTSNNGNLNNGTVHGAIYLHEHGHTTIKSFDNQGTIKGKRAGIVIIGSKNTTITHLKNSGTIEITNGNGNVNSTNVSAGILIGQLNMQQQSESKPIYDTIENTGTIKGGNYGIFIEGGSIKNLKNSGTIEGKKDGIAFFNAGGPLKTTITNLEIEQGIVKGGENGINLSRIEFDRRNNNEKNERIVENLIIKEGAIVEGGSGSGLVLGNVEDKRKNGQAQQSNNTDTYQLTGTIQVNGTLKGTKAGITNYKDMGTEGKEVIVIGEQGKIEGVVKNESGGTLKGNITNKGTGTLEIDNKGTVGNNTVIKNENSSGSIKILDWKLENQDNGN
ncbi:hypothetical protein CCY97_08030, partial [Helicobacter sp. 10-6591]